MSDDSFDAKFGPPPSAWTRERVLAVQFVACALVLVLVQPPFVTDAEQRVQPATVALASALAVVATVWLASANEPEA